MVISIVVVVIVLAVVVLLTQMLLENHILRNIILRQSRKTILGANRHLSMFMTIVVTGGVGGGAGG